MLGEDKMYRRGVDTETYEGDIKCLCNDARCIEPSTVDEVFRFLQGTHNEVYMTFNLRFDAQSIMKMLPRENLLEIGSHGINTTTYKDWDITYIPKKKLTIRKGKKATHLYDIAQFYFGMTLDSAAQKYLADRKSNTELGIDRQRIGNEAGYYESNRDIIQKYCIKDAALTRSLGDFMANTFAKIEFPQPDEPPINFNNPISVANIAEKWLLSRKQGFPRTPKWMKENKWETAAQLAYGGGAFRTIQRGHFTQPLYDYDLNSAYPATMSTLPNWYNGVFEKIVYGSNYDDYDYTWMLCDFDCEHIRYDSGVPWKFSEEIEIGGEKWNEIEIKVQNHRIYYPTGKRTAWLTGLDIDLLKRNGYTCDMKYGIGWRETRNKYEPPFEWMADFYEKRKEVKARGDDAIQYAMKIFLNSLYGKLVSVKSKYAKLTNFFYGSYVTGDCRCKVSQVLIDNPHAVINIATDGVLATSPIEGLQEGTKLGEWEKNVYEGGGIVIGNGMRQVYYDKDRENFSTYARGLTNKRDWDMFADLVKNKEKDIIYYESTRPVQLGEVLNFTKVFKFSDLNRFVTRKRALRVNSDTSRAWKGEYTNFADFLSLSPMTSLAIKLEDIL